MSTLRAGVIGVGYLGRFHAQKYAAMEDVDLVGVVDTDPDRAGAVADEVGTRAFTDYLELLDGVDAVSIVVPTRFHHQVAAESLRRGIHVLVEKPVTTTLEEADDLVRLAAQGNLVLQVGHLERFNAAVRAVADMVGTPMFIESQRLASFNPRGADVSVVLDLMIHDIDIILKLVDQPVARIDANGAPVISSDIDIANARIQFANGCVANVTASRVSLKAERKMRLFQRNSYISLDFQQRTLDVRSRVNTKRDVPAMEDIRSEQHSYEDGDALRAEITSFVACVRNGRTPLVTGADGRQALATAIEITRQLRDNPLPDQPLQ
ncbi:Gfo/Idh/MocA family oxidoreductase [Aquisalimonas sp. 2447]|uniref:Gfo/Idh/MocA family protein n=1 Tax=Aquisalimonas sp. 2447 TaxID=2740807 RepID=UPI00143239F5|nr:Gfo/Idh/MocA family oxidoreductase [Aquisalimonas sp. 2447]QIT55584.1 Gfo/Idh/MocA family oxidoreductase [Aquisalimonas sp. 2447]